MRSKILKPTCKLLLPLTGLQGCCSERGRPDTGPWPAFPPPLVYIGVVNVRLTHAALMNTNI